MDKLGKWAKGKTELYINDMLTIAALSDPIYYLFKDYCEFLRNAGITNIHEIEKWFNYYKEYKLNKNELNEILNEEDEVIQFIIRLIINHAEENGLLIEEPEENESGIPGKLYELTKAELENKNEIELHEKDFRKTQSNLDLKDFNKYPGIVFFIRVMFPCLIIYGEYPSELYQKAKEGDLESFCKLLRIDKTIICDQKFAEYIIQLEIHRTSKQSNEIIRAFTGSYKKMSLKKIKMRVGAFLSDKSRTYGYELTSTDIRTIFDDAARYYRNKDIDDILMVSPEAITKTKQRYKDHWKFLS